MAGKDISSWMQKNYGKPTNTLESYDSRDVFNTFWLRDDASEFLEGFQTGRNKPLLGIFFKESANFFHTEGDHYFVNLNPVIYNSFGEQVIQVSWSLKTPEVWKYVPVLMTVWAFTCLPPIIRPLIRVCNRCGKT